MIIPPQVKMSTFSPPLPDALSKKCKIMGVHTPHVAKAYGLLTEKQSHIRKSIRKDYLVYGFPKEIFLQNKQTICRVGYSYSNTGNKFQQ